MLGEQGFASNDCGKRKKSVFTPSIIEGNHRSLAILVAYLQGKIEVEKKIPGDGGKKVVFGIVREN